MSFTLNQTSRLWHQTIIPLSTSNDDHLSLHHATDIHHHKKTTRNQVLTIKTSFSICNYHLINLNHLTYFFTLSQLNSLSLHDLPPPNEQNVNLTFITSTFHSFHLQLIATSFILQTADEHSFTSTPSRSSKQHNLVAIINLVTYIRLQQLRHQHGHHVRIFLELIDRSLLNNFPPINNTNNHLTSIATIRFVRH